MEDVRQVVLSTERFEVRERLGQGGAGVVYAAFDREHERVVALKLLPEMSAIDIGRLKHEFRALTDVAHPNLVRLHELVSDGSQWFFTMELVAGRSFLEVVRTPDTTPPPNVAEMETRPIELVLEQTHELARAETLVDEALLNATVLDSHTRAILQRVSGRPRIPELRAALAQLAQGVAAIHAAGKLHCDLKPQNVLITPEGRVVVLDFGLVTDAQADLSPAARYGDRISNSGVVSGTPAYMSPEQASGESVSAASDWYAVGVMLYEALTGRLPFDGPMLELMRVKQVSDPPPPDLRAPDLPEDLCELCMALLRRVPAERPSEHEILRRLCGESWADDSAVYTASLAPTAHGGSLDLVGRGAELAQLEHAFSMASRKQPVTVYVHGNAGIGKSRLLQELLARIAGAGTVILAGRCYERERLPFKAFDSVIDALTGHLMSLRDSEVEALLPRDIHSLSRLFPVLLRVPAIAQAKRPAFEAPDPHAMRRAAFAATKELLARIAARAPLVVHIDDLHWGDVDSASLLIELLEPPDPPAMLFIASFRSADATTSPFLRTLLAHHPAPAPAGSSVRPAARASERPSARPSTRASGHTEQPAAPRPVVIDLALEPLSAQESVQLVQSLGGAVEGAVAGALGHADAIAKEAAGNPFFVAQLVHYLSTQHAKSVSLGVGPITLEQVLRERLSHLPEAALSLLEVVSVAGHPIPRDIAIEAAGIQAQADSALSLLRAGAWLRSQGPRKDDVVECYHDRVREVVAQGVPEARLIARHARIALTLEQSGHASPVDLAEHFRAAGHRDKAAHYAERAAEASTYALAFDDAARWYELALSLGAHDLSARRELRIKLAEALSNAGRPDAAAQSYLLAANSAEPQLVLELRRRAAEQWLVGGHIDEGVTALGSVLQAVQMRLAKTPQRALLSLLARRARVKLRGLAWQRRAQDAIPPGQLMRIDTCWSVAIGLSTVDTIRAADFQAQHLLLALASGEPYRVARALAVEAGFAATNGRSGRERARSVGAAARALAVELEPAHPHALGLSMMTTGMSAYLMGDWAQALRDCDQAERILLERCTGVLWELTNARRFALSSLAFMGRISELSRRAPKLLTDARERGHLYAETDLRTRLLPWSWLAQDKPDTAIENADDALRRWTQQGFHLQHYNHLLTLVHCELYRGHTGAALARMNQTWPPLSRSMLLRIQALRAEILHAKGRAMLASLSAGSSKHSTSKHSASKQQVARIADKLDDEQMPYTTPLAALLRAGLQKQSASLDACRTQLEQAAAGFQAVDMELHAAVSRNRLGALIGGDQGADLCAQADAFFDAEGIVDGDAFTRLFAPGFE